jgi:predicted site-specific integrase-resolvase
MKNNQQPEMMSQEVFCELYGISRTVYFQQIKKGLLKQTSLGRRRYIKRIDAEAWLAALKSS